MNALKRSLLSAMMLILFAGYAVAGEFYVTKVFDGDSCRVTGHDIEFKVRLIGIDTPEKGRGKRPNQPYSKKARTYLSSMILNQTVSIYGYGYGPYGRVIAGPAGAFEQKLTVSLFRDHSKP